MNKHLYLTAAVITILFGLDHALAQAPASHRTSGDAGRYQACVVEGRLFVIDTATGQCWSRLPSGRWRDEGNPSRAKSGGQEQRETASATLKLPSEPVELTVVQREERAIPGSDGSVRIRLGDITEGQVLLCIVTADGAWLVEPTSVEQGDRVTFSVGDEQYALHIAELRNVLLGDDFARLSVSRAGAGDVAPVTGHGPGDRADRGDDSAAASQPRPSPHPGNRADQGDDPAAASQEGRPSPRERDTRAIRGRVVLDGKPLAGGKVLLTSESDILLGAKTDDIGKFQIDRVRRGFYEVTIAHPEVPARYSSEETSGLQINVGDGAANEFQFELRSQ